MYRATTWRARATLLEAADRRRGSTAIVYTSTVGALGHARTTARPADEDDAGVGWSEMVGHYKRSKFLAERVAEEFAAAGLPVVIVNPSAPVGDMDVKPTATGQMVLDHLKGRMSSAYVDTGLNLVDVRDVALGHLLAAERGKVGEKYILGYQDLSLIEIMQILSGITGIAAPRIKLPHWVPLTFAAIDTFAARMTRREPRVALDAVRLSRHAMYFDCSKAVRELGLPQTPVEQPLRRAVDWFRDNGYVDQGASAA